ncbi:hypothetical protein [Komagataeibacter sp. FNDCR2]|uniref:hypothetical protein n=1 Tax=Komagataeibacter sp. FNDCR2 TaxID=2878682 RepID=UPI001E3213C7|nr:hypothetical protein [Komagataeibacter sp. FNDCR2]MCE2576551.1 hypothetical protein [Komagataeibacter sp. FNDCR2]
MDNIFQKKGGTPNGAPPSSGFYVRRLLLRVIAMFMVTMLMITMFMVAMLTITLFAVTMLMIAMIAAVMMTALTFMMHFGVVFRMRHDRKGKTERRSKKQCFFHVINILLT